MSDEERAAMAMEGQRSRATSNAQETVMLEEMSVYGGKRRVEMSMDQSSGGGFGLPVEELDKHYFDPESAQFKELPGPAKKFYRSQNEEIEAYREIAKILTDSGTSHEERKTEVARAERLVSFVSISANICLLIALILAVVFSGALSLIASVLDSSLDLLSGLIMVATAAAKRRVNLYKYPQGRERIEPVGVLVFSAVMGTASLILIVSAVEQLIEDPLHRPTLDWISIGLLIGDLVVKAFLLAFCIRYAKITPIARVLSQDHRNDLFLNSVAIGAAALGAFVWGPLDPIGSILISLWTMYNWSSTCLEQVYLLTGRAASPEFLKRLTWLCYNHDERITAIDTVRAFHFGNRYLVEIDVVLPPMMPLREAHDIGEALQKKVEKLEEVERAFVHLDFETDHHPNSEHKQWGLQ